ncbi:SMI1/KNR4 family protein [Strepomyces sp. STD 3.1]|uniref:SMI1/KNR4 family protein n=1 Tax=Streptomyces sp. NPDC058985 TaxID=3346684 RepID=UPI001F354051|nr:SMI1/KNR4 family protein [Streptomyces sp. STD 3.1]
MPDRRNAEEAAAQVTVVWGRIERWLWAHAPTSAALLRPPAGEADIVAVEEAIEVAFPSTLRAWYRLHDGIDDPAAGESWWPAGFLPGHQGWYRLAQLQDAYVTQTRDWEFEPGRIPISCTPDDIWYGRYIDARPDEPSYGSLGRWAADEEPEPLPTFTSGWPLQAWLTALADALEQGRCLIEPGGRRDAYTWPALTVCGGLTWVDPRDERQVPEGRILLDGPR